MVHGLESRICPPPFGQSLMAIARPDDANRSANVIFWICCCAYLNRAGWLLAGTALNQFGQVLLSTLPLRPSPAYLSSHNKLI